MVTSGAGLTGLEIEAAQRVDLAPPKRRLPNPKPVNAPAGIDAARRRIDASASSATDALLDENRRVVDNRASARTSSRIRRHPSARDHGAASGRGCAHLTDLFRSRVPVGGQPLLERIVGQMKESGIEQIVVTIPYQPEITSDNVGDGTGFGVTMTYIQEDGP